MSRRRPPAASAADAGTAPTLKALLDAQAGFDIEDVDGFADHRPMALHALARLGADAARLEAFARTAQARLRPAPPAATWPLGDAWAAHFGRREAWPMYRDLFAQWLDHEAAGDTLQQVLPQLLPGLAGAAFHGLIRTAHAVSAAHRVELADALACWAACWAPLGQPRPDIAPDTDDPEAVLRRLAVVRGNGPSLSGRLRAAAQAPGFDELAASLALGEDSVPRLAGLAAMAYAASGDFGVLHLVTSGLALHQLLRFVEPEDTAVRDAARAAWWRGFLATVSAAGLQAQPLPTPRPWPALRAAAIAHDDAHVIKLVDACDQWQQLAPGAGPWAAAAERALR